ncbi:uncharacterized protein LOC110744937 isoform X2 [Prunus avium]|uniref:Uncharacterized protein LOC110744937 isoform X2 n=1 Tax=Prunus avium TaxID=42229 RepID=A0A6P5R6Y2_PRUAV|nr:uncharacterized protein LOC110744937 isoform X2 [Prunus avium]
MMSTLQITSCQPCNYFRNTSQSLRLSSKPTVIQHKCMAVLKNKQWRAVSKYHQSAGPVCLLGGKGKNESGGGDEGSPWKALEKAMGNLKKEGSIEDVLRQQIEKKEFYEERGGGGSGGGGGSSGDGVGGSGGSEDEGLDGILDETLQVILATIGFIFLLLI